MLVLEGPAIEVARGFVDDAFGAVTATAESICAADAAVVVAGMEVVLVGSCAAGNEAILAASVVEALGTAVQRLPPIEVMKNPAGRDGLVDMTRKNSDTVAREERNSREVNGLYRKIIAGALKPFDQEIANAKASTVTAIVKMFGEKRRKNKG